MDFSVIDKNSFKPIYFQLAEVYRLGIDNNEIEESSQLPTEDELCKKHDVSRNTIRNFLKKLENEGYVYRVKGKGTFVSKPKDKKKVIIAVLPFFPKGHSTVQSIVSGLLVRAQEDGWSVRIIKEDQLTEILEEMSNASNCLYGVTFIRPSAIIGSLQNMVDSIEKTGVSVIVEGHVTNCNCNNIDIDDEDAMNKIMEHLVGLGHKRFSLISAPQEDDNSDFGERRMQACKKFAASNDLEVLPEIIASPSESGSINNACSRIFETDNPPTAIVPTSDVMAVNIINWLLDHGYNVPEDVSVTGFDDLDFCRYTRPTVTSVRQDYYELGYLTCDSLIKMITDYNNKRLQTKVKLDLIVRGSTAVCRTNKQGRAYK